MATGTSSSAYQDSSRAGVHSSPNESLSEATAFRTVYHVNAGGHLVQAIPISQSPVVQATKTSASVQFVSQTQVSYCLYMFGMLCE